MDRQIVYPGQIPLETDLLHAQKDALIGLAMACQAVLGPSTVVDGLACTPTTPASLSVTIGQGSLYAVEPVDASAYSSLPADTTDSIVKQGIQLAPTTLTLTPPGTVGYAINYLIEAAYLDQDGGATVLPYYNASNPSQAYSGPNNSGAAQNTTRQGMIAVQAKAGVAAAAGSQITPAADPGYVPLYVVTVAYGTSTITAGNIAAVAGAPFITPKLPAVPAAIQAQSGNFAVDTGAVNALAVTLSPAPAALVAGLPVRVKSANTVTGASTLNVNGLGAVAIKRPDGTALQTGDVLANQTVQLVYDGTNFILPALPGVSATVMAAAIQAQAGNYAVDTGAVNAYAVTLSPAPTALGAGLQVRMKAATASTGPSTLNVNGLGATTIKRRSDGGALGVPDIVAGGIYELIYDGAIWQLLTDNRLRGYQVFTASGTFTVPAGVTLIRAAAIGGGGAGSGCGGHGGGGGGAGNLATGSFAVTPGQQVTITIGAGASSAPGVTGGTTSIGALLSATGGTGGASSGAPGTGSATGGTGGAGGGSGTQGATPSSTPLALFYVQSLSTMAGNTDDNCAGQGVYAGGGGGAGGYGLPGASVAQAYSGNGFGAGGNGARADFTGGIIGNNAAAAGLQGGAYIEWG